MRDYPGSFLSGSAILSNETLTLLASIGPISSHERLGEILRGWVWFEKYGQSLLNQMRAIDILPMQPKPKPAPKAMSMPTERSQQTHKQKTHPEQLDLATVPFTAKPTGSEKLKPDKGQDKRKAQDMEGQRKSKRTRGQASQSTPTSTPTTTLSTPDHGILGSFPTTLHPTSQTNTRTPFIPFPAYPYPYIQHYPQYQTPPTQPRHTPWPAPIFTTPAPSISARSPQPLVAESPTPVPNTGYNPYLVQVHRESQRRAPPPSSSQPQQNPSYSYTYNPYLTPPVPYPLSRSPYGPNSDPHASQSPSQS